MLGRPDAFVRAGRRDTDLGEDHVRPLGPYGRQQRVKVAAARAQLDLEQQFLIARPFASFWERQYGLPQFEAEDLDLRFAKDDARAARRALVCVRPARPRYTAAK